MLRILRTRLWLATGLRQVLLSPGVACLADSRLHGEFLDDVSCKFCLGKCVDWSKIEKSTYLQAMTASVADGSRIKQLLRNALTDDISSREMFMKGIDYSYYYEQEDEV